MKSKYIFNGALVTGAVLILITFVMKFWGTGQISLSVLTLLQGIFLADSKLNLGDSEVMKTLIFQIELLLVSPYIIAIAVIVFGLLKQRWSYIVTSALGLLETVFLLLDLFLFIPMRMSGMLGKVADDVLELPYIGSIILDKAGEVIGLSTSGDFRNIIVSGIGPAYAICVTLFAVIFVLSLCAFLIEGKDDEKTEFQMIKDPAVIICLCGEMAGLRIPAEDSDDIFVGSDARCCNLVVSQKGVLGKHCLIRYLKEYGKYQVVDYAHTGTFINEDIIRTGETRLVERGSRLELGDIRNVLILE